MRKYAFIVVSLLALTAAQAQPKAANVDASVETGVVLNTWNAATIKKDAHGAAAVFTEDAVRVTPEGIINGRAAIEQAFEAGWRDYVPSDGSVSPTLIELGDGAVVRVGSWSGTYKNTPVKGYWSAVLVRGSDAAWKIRQASYNVTLPPH